MRREISDPNKKYTLRHGHVDEHTKYSLRREPWVGEPPYRSGQTSEGEQEARKRHTLAKFATVGAAVLGGYALYQVYPEVRRYLHRKSLSHEI